MRIWNNLKIKNKIKIYINGIQSKTMSSLVFVRDTTNNKNVPLQVDGSNKLSVNDSTAQSTLSTISSTLSGGLSVNDSTAQSSLSAIETSVGGTLVVSDTVAQTTLSSISSSVSGTLSTSDITAQSSLSNIESSVAGTLAVDDSNANLSLSSIDSAVNGTLVVSDTTAQSSLSSIDTRLAGTITTTQGVSRTNGNLSVASSVINGDVSTSVDGNNFKQVMVFGNLGASGDITIQVSNDNTNWYEDSNSNFYSNYSTYDVAGRFENVARYWRVKYNVSSTVTVRYAMLA